MSKTRVVILFGGRSAEHEISLLSARNVLAALDRDRFEPVLIGIDKPRPAGASSPSERWPARPAIRARWRWTPGAPGRRRGGAGAADRRPMGDADDVVFPVLHGTFGEDGTVQACWTWRTSRTSARACSGSAVGMDKDVAKRLLRDAGIPVVDFVLVTAAAFARDPRSRAGAGRAVRVPAVRQAGQRRLLGGRDAGARRAARWRRPCAPPSQFDRKVLIERAVDAREIECAVLGNDEPHASVPGEILVDHPDGFYSYEAKYVDADGASFRIPAEISAELHGTGAGARRCRPSARSSWPAWPASTSSWSEGAPARLCT